VISAEQQTEEQKQQLNVVMRSAMEVEMERVDQILAQASVGELTEATFHLPHPPCGSALLLPPG
jgi:hypothetical protein